MGVGPMVRGASGVSGGQAWAFSHVTGQCRVAELPSVPVCVTSRPDAGWGPAVGSWGRILTEALGLGHPQTASACCWECVSGCASVCLRPCECVHAHARATWLSEDVEKCVGVHGWECVNTCERVSVNKHICISVRVCTRAFERQCSLCPPPPFSGRKAPRPPWCSPAPGELEAEGPPHGLRAGLSS